MRGRLSTAAAPDLDFEEEVDFEVGQECEIFDPPPDGAKPLDQPGPGDWGGPRCDAAANDTGPLWQRRAMHVVWSLDADEPRIVPTLVLGPSDGDRQK